MTGNTQPDCNNGPTFHEHPFNERQGASDSVEIIHTHYHAPKEDTETVVSIDVETQTGDARTTAEMQELVLTRGSKPKPSEHYEGDPFAIEGDPDIGLQRTIIPEEAPALAYFLHALETYGLNKSRVADWFQTKYPNWMQVYQEWRTNLSGRDRRLRLMDLLEWRTEYGDPYAEVYLEGETAGTWRSTDLSDESRQIAQRIQSSIEVRPALCYRTAQYAALLHAENRRLRDRIKYVEGVALPATGAQCIRHAWIEVDDEVVEVTWPWHDLDGDDAVYFGTSFPLDAVEAARKRDVGGPVAIDEKSLKKYNRVHHGDDAQIQYEGAT